MPGVYRQTGQHGNYDKAGSPKWKGGVAVIPGDLVYRDANGYDQPAALYPWTTDLPTTAATFKDAFRGVSECRRTTQQTADGDKADGGIDETGEFTFPCAALGAASPVGSLVGPAKDVGNNLANQLVAITTVVAGAIGVLTTDAAIGATFLTFKINPGMAVTRGTQTVI